MVNSRRSQKSKLQAIDHNGRIIFTAIANCDFLKMNNLYKINSLASSGLICHICDRPISTIYRPILFNKVLAIPFISVQ